MHLSLVCGLIGALFQFDWIAETLCRSHLTFVFKTVNTFTVLWSVMANTDGRSKKTITVLYTALHQHLLYLHFICIQKSVRVYGNMSHTLFHSLFQHWWSLFYHFCSYNCSSQCCVYLQPKSTDKLITNRGEISCFMRGFRINCSTPLCVIQCCANLLNRGQIELI